MREYGQVQTCFWTDPEMQALSDNAKLLALYLLTNPQSNAVGCFRIPDGYLMADLAWTQQTVSKAFAELLQTGFVERDSTSGWTIIPKYLKWNPIANPNIGKKVEKIFASIPENISIYGTLLDSIEAYANHLPNSFLDRFKTVYERYRNKEPTLPNPTQPNPKGDKSPPCPHEEVINLYHEILPMCPTVRVWNDSRKGYLQQRWREKAEYQDTDWWRRFFVYIAKSKFLTGQTDGKDGKPPFLADLEWIVKPSNFAKIVEGKYHRGSHD